MTTMTTVSVYHTSIILLLMTLVAFCYTTSAFTNRLPSLSHPNPLLRRPSLNSAKSAHPRTSKSWTAQERDAIFERDGEYFKLDRIQGKIEFGSSSLIRTTLDESDETSIRRWLLNDKEIAMGIWDPNLIKEVEPNVYRLKLMTLMFVTIQLSPNVDMRMWTDEKGSFRLESIAFDPNIQIFPGLGVSADSLGILIDVIGELHAGKDGRSVEGKIAFRTSGGIPPPMRLLPESALRTSMSTINRTITNFAIRSFQKGSREKFREFLLSEKKARKES